MNEQYLHKLMLQISSSGRNTSWGKTNSCRNNLTGGISIREEYSAVIFKKHSSRVDEMFEADTIELLIQDVCRYIKEHRLEWTEDYPQIPKGKKDHF